jgi:hypothetical protein
LREGVPSARWRIASTLDSNLMNQRETEVRIALLDNPLAG